MKLTRVITQIAVLAAVLASGAAQAIVLLDTTSTISPSVLTQTGRLSRNAIAQDWSGGEPFPGIINTSTMYAYTVFGVDVGITPYIQINFDSVSTNTFVSVYQTSYLPNSSPTGNRGFDTNWLGDAGTSGNFFGTDPLFFQVLAQPNTGIVVVINNTSPGLGLTDSFRLIVEGFIDTEFTDPAPRVVPEPSTLLLCFAPLALFAARRATKRRGDRREAALA